MNLIGGAHCKSKGPEPVVVRALGMAEVQLPRLGELVRFQIQLMMMVDFIDKKREKGVVRLTVKTVREVARDEARVRDALDILWKDPKSAVEIMAELRA